MGYRGKYSRGDRRGLVVAFNAGNLEPVVRAVRERSPDREIVICGDDDQWTPGRPGRTKAEAAAKAHGCTTIFPTLKTLDGRPTDFNDLATREGLETVWRQVETGKAEKCGKTFKFNSISDLKATPPRFIIKPILEADTLAVAFGDPETYKSFLAIAMACCVAAGISFHGHKVKSEPAAYIAGEGHGGLARRCNPLRLHLLFVYGGDAGNRRAKR
jgi:hypothetical protein